MNNRIAVAVSGGIDSLVAAFLLKEQGFDVSGLHFVTGYEDFPAVKKGRNFVTVCPDSDFSDIRPEESGIIGIHKISKQLGIQIHVIDIRDEFYRYVAGYFYDSYISGITPNPCVACNTFIKFGLMLEKAVFFGASKIATGHYARFEISDNGETGLFQSRDTLKDQSYFLALVKKEALIKACFPLSAFTKEEVREIAGKNGLYPVSEKESQDICFIKGGYNEFMEKQPGFAAKTGNIVDVSGRIIGKHKGLHLFTVGQRRGINCPASEPYYVLGLNTETNQLVAGFRSEIMKSSCRVENINWMNFLKSGEYRFEVKIRYAHRPAGAVVKISGNNNKNAEIFFDEPQLAITPGQTAVFYDTGEVLGGGFICRD